LLGERSTDEVGGRAPTVVLNAPGRDKAPRRVYQERFAKLSDAVRVRRNLLPSFGGCGH